MARKQINRQSELTKNKKIMDKALEGYDAISEGYRGMAGRINDILDYWDIYNCKLNGNQFYTGNSQAYVPAVHDAIEARKTRFLNQLFPDTGRYLQAVTEEDELPMAYIALMEHYVETSRLRTVGIPALLRNGDVEGHYNVYVDWSERTRYVTKRTVSGPTINGVQLEADEVGKDDQIEDMDEEEVVDFSPTIEVIPDADVLVLPAISDSLEEALYTYGGSVSILRRWSKSMIDDKVTAGEIDEEQADILKEQMNSQIPNLKDTKKAHTDAAGVKKGGKFALVYETWRVMKVDDKKRLVRIYYGGDNVVLSIRLNPFWCDLCPLISLPAEKIGGSFKGVSKVSYVAPLQYLANDFLNEGADSASYALLPIIMTDPISNPRVGSMVVDMGAIWEVDPAKTKIAEFPALWKDALALVQQIVVQIMNTLSVNPSMVPQRQGAPGKKPTQAEVATEQQIDLLTTADAVLPVEFLLTEVIRRFMGYDAQYRKDDLTVKAFGRMGMQTVKQTVPPQQQGNAIELLWAGVEQVRDTQKIQQQMAGLNVLRQIPPDMMGGHVIDATGIIERFVENTYGARQGGSILRPLSDMMGMQPEEENPLLLQGTDLPVAPNDDDRKHLQVHAQALQEAHDPHAKAIVQAHMARHQMQMSQKNQAAAARAQQGQGGGQQGRPTNSRPGAATSGPRQQGAPGQIHQDQLPLAPPRQ